MRSFPPALAQTSPVSGKSPLDCRLDCRGSSRLPDRKFPRLDRMQGPPLGGLLLFWVIGSQRLTTASQLAGIALAIQYACNRAAESLVIRFPKFLTVRGLPANQPGLKGCHLSSRWRRVQPARDRRWAVILQYAVKARAAARSWARPQRPFAPPHSMTSSARPSSGNGIVSPSALAVLRLITSSTFTACWTGRSAGLAPLRIFPTKTPA